MSTAVQLYRNLKGDKAIWLIFIVLSMFSILAIYSATGSEAYRLQGGNTEYYLIKQLILVSLGIVVTYVCYQLNYIQYAKIAPILLAVVVPLLLYTVVFGDATNDARRWLSIPWVGSTFQPSDLAKVALILYVARSLAVRQEFIKDFRSAFVPIIVPVVIVCGLIAPADLSTAALLFATCLMMMFIGRVSLKYVALLVLMGIILMAILVLLGSLEATADYFRLDTWLARLEGTDLYQVEQSKIAIASGEWFGVGPGNSNQRNFVPYAYADFIYAIICEEYGMIGGMVIIVMFLWLLFRCIHIVTRCPKAFGAILAMGLCLNIVIQAFANIAVSVHLVPVTGLTLPLISSGGTSLLFTCMSIGIILSVSKYVEQAELDKIELDKMETNESTD